MRSLFYTGFERRFERAHLGQFEALGPIISAGVSAAATFYSAHMQKLIAEQQKRTQEEIAARQQAAADAAAKAKADAAAKAVAAAQGTPGAPGTVATPTIFGVNQNVLIVGGVAAALVFGLVAIMVTKSGPKMGKKA